MDSQIAPNEEVGEGLGSQTNKSMCRADGIQTVILTRPECKKQATYTKTHVYRLSVGIFTQDLRLPANTKALQAQ